MSSAVLQAFQNRILNEFLPTFCDDPSRSWDVAGFKEDWHRISEIDAADFLRGIEGELVKHQGRGLYRALRSHACEQFFWSGVKQKSPRPITLWVEPIITVAVLARLHFDLDWPKALIGTQSKDWAFDVMTYSLMDSPAEHIACEVKKSVSEIDQLIERMIRLGKVASAEQTTAAIAKKERNAFRKLEALRCRRPPLFWAVGPERSGCAFRMGYSEGGIVSFQEIEIQELDYRLLVKATAGSEKSFRATPETKALGTIE